MTDPHNHDSFSRIAAGLCFLHIWGALGGLWYLAFQAMFFGEGIWGYVIAGGVLLLLVNPVVPWQIANLALRPAILHMLKREIVNGGGCVTGIVVFLAAAGFVVWGLTRMLETALIVFLAAPVGAFVAALLATFSPPLLRRIRWPTFRRRRP